MRPASFEEHVLQLLRWPGPPSLVSLAIRAKLVPAVNGKEIDSDQAREREEKLARGEEGLRHVTYQWKWE